MVELLEKHDTYQQICDHLKRHDSSNGRAWLGQVREAAMNRFANLGWPSTRDEEWRYTNLKPLIETDFSANETSDSIPTPDTLQPFAIGPTSAQLVFVDGCFCPELSQTTKLPTGIYVGNLNQALNDRGDLVRSHFEKSLRDSSDALSALNAALVKGGAFIHIENGIDVPDPIYLMYLSGTSVTPQMTHPRQLIIAESNCRATVVEHYASLRNKVYWNNAVTEARVETGAELTHYLIDRDCDQAFNTSTLCVDQDHNSRFRSHTALFGGRLVRNNVHVNLNGSGCDSLVNGLFVASGSQHMDNHMRVVHAAPNCDSRQFYKGVLDDHARGVFTGRIVVRQDAQKTDAKQTNRNLLLSDNAQINTKPQLEIYADDVKCTHGATTGQLDDEAMFYLRSRGITGTAARALLIYAFAAEGLDRMDEQPLQDYLSRELIQRLAQRGLLEPAFD